MTNVQIDTIIDKVQAILVELKDAGDLGSVDVSDKIIDPLHSKKVAYPFAYLNPTFFNQGQHDTFRSIDRTYTVAITLVFNNSSKSTTHKSIALTVEKVADKFQEKITLDGDLSGGWVDPSMGAPFKFEGSKDKIGVDLVLNIHTIRDFTFAGQ